MVRVDCCIQINKNPIDAVHNISNWYRNMVCSLIETARHVAILLHWKIIIRQCRQMENKEFEYTS